MRDYVKEMMTAWAEAGEQAAYDLGGGFLKEIQSDYDSLRRQESAIRALGMVLQEHAEVDSTPEPAEPGHGLSAIEPSERSKRITDAANEVRSEQQQNWGGSESHLVKTQSVLDALNNKGLDLGVQQPLAVIGTVLASADGFSKVSRNTFLCKLPTGIPR